MKRLAILTCLWFTQTAAHSADPAKRFVYPGEDGRLVYPADERGNRLPDFSHAGYGGGEVIPAVPSVVVVSAGAGDRTEVIQRAIDHVATLSPDGKGFRGAVLISDGRHEIAGQIRMTGSGIVLRGCGEKTVLVATGQDRRSLIRVRGRADRHIEEPAYNLEDRYVPVGSATVRVGRAEKLKVGDRVLVEHPGTREWVSALGMDRFPSRDKGSYLDWRPDSVGFHWDRTVLRVEEDQVTLDAPITGALDSTLTHASLRRYTWPGRLSKVGVENLRLESSFDASNKSDEDHAWSGVTVENAEDVWVRGVRFAHFAGSAVTVWESARRVTVQDCDSGEPVSEVGGHRRHTFFTAGEQTLFLRCTSDLGRHDFAVGHLASGPNAFVHCKATNARHYSGPIGSWATGVLYDNVAIDGNGLALTNRETDDQGVGWAAANSVLWQCSAPLVTCRKPPTAQNWAIGVWGQFVGDGHWRQLNEFVKPASLFEAQLAERLPGQAREILARPAIPILADGVKRVEELPLATVPRSPSTSPKPLTLDNGWLTVDGHVLAGNRTGTAWWRGSILPARATEVGVGVTRFVPLRDGSGFTDDLDRLTDDMRAKGVTVLDHHWGLWYDRRRDDHQMVRRIDGEVWAPFYEQPWARSGKGTAWDGLSKYDLTQFNPWYFARLKRFAELAQRKGRVLVQQMYFQHNILEAGAHWADFPWRPANCLQETGFPEPPEYVGGKRVFMARDFYDVTHPLRRELHRKFIRHCLDELGDCPNVIFQTGEEFTGPRAFVEFWLDTIAEWKRETGKSILVGLSCTRDVQDAILADPARSRTVSVIDLKYWWYTADGKVFDPKGDTNLAPRQQVREWKGPKSISGNSVARAVREYRAKFPDKAVTVSLDVPASSGWAVLAAGGSIPRLPAETDAELAKAMVKMKPIDPKGLPAGAYALADADRNYFVWSPEGGPVSLDLSGVEGDFAVRSIDPANGKVRVSEGRIRGGQAYELKPAGNGPAIWWLCR